VLACYRYIEMKPVRAEMVRHPRHYRWSSYRTNAEGHASKVLTPHELPNVGTLGGDAPGGLSGLVQDPEVLRDIRAATNGNYALGSRRFQ